MKSAFFDRVERELSAIDPSADPGPRGPAPIINGERDLGVVLPIDLVRLHILIRLKMQAFERAVENHRDLHRSTESLHDQAACDAFHTQMHHVQQEIECLSELFWIAVQEELTVRGVAVDYQTEILGIREGFTVIAATLSAEDLERAIVSEMPNIVVAVSSDAAREISAGFSPGGSRSKKPRRDRLN